MSTASAALVRAGVDPEKIEVQERAILGPHIFVDCGAYSLSIVGEINLGVLAMQERPSRDPNEPLPLREDVLEIGLLTGDRSQLLAEPLRYLPFARAAEICRLALVGDVSAFDLYLEEDR